jgi:PAS domain S-box-containing protein
MSESEFRDGDYRRRLYDVMRDETLSYAQKRREALAIGRDYLGVENAHVERVDERTHTVVESVGETDLLETGATLRPATTYCRRTLELDEPLALTDAPEQGWADDPAFERWGLRCYLGATITVENEVHGTVCFVSESARDADFTEADRAFVEMVAHALGRERECERHEDRLRERQRELDRQERALDRSERKYQSLVTTAPDAIFLVDVETGETVEANQAAAEMVGRDRGELEGIPLTRALPPEQRDRYREEFGRLVEPGETRSRFADGTPLLIRRSDGTDVPVEVNASVVELEGDEYVQAIFRDISDRRERQRELRVKNRAIEEAAIGISIADADSVDNPLVYHNERFRQLTGYDASELDGRNCRLLQGPDTDPETIADIGDAIASERPITREILNYRSDGTPFWNELTITPVRDYDGDTSHFLGFQRDVTDRHRRERLITVLNRVLRHNLRNDLSVVTGLAEEISERTGGRPAEMAERIETVALALADLSDKARTLEDATADPKEPVERDVAPIVRRVAADLRNTSDGTVSVDVPDEATAVVTDRFEVALAELGANAVEHGDGSVSFVVEAPDDAETVRVRVEDGGPGLPAGQRRVLRDGQETQLEHSSGLGLLLVNWIVTGAGGDLRTTVDDGTTVTIDLQVDCDETPAAND